MPKESFLELARKIKKHMPPEIFDCILFGSLVKGKENPRDVDILIVCKDKNPEIVLKFLKRVERLLSEYFGREVKIHHDTITLDEFYSLSKYFYISDEILASGFSVRIENFLSELFGMIGGYVFLIDVPRNKIPILKYYLLKADIPSEALIVFSYKMIFVGALYYQHIKNILEDLNFEYRKFPMLLSKRVLAFFKKRSEKIAVFSMLKKLKKYL